MGLNIIAVPLISALPKCLAHLSVWSLLTGRKKEPKYNSAFNRTFWLVCYLRAEAPIWKEKKKSKKKKSCVPEGSGNGVGFGICVIQKDCWLMGWVSAFLQQSPQGMLLWSRTASFRAGPCALPSPLGSVDWLSLSLSLWRTATTADQVKHKHHVKYGTCKIFIPAICTKFVTSWPSVQQLPK